MIIGQFKLEGGVYQGHISTLTVSTKASIFPVGQKSREKHPDYRVTTPDLDIGAAWDKTRDGNSFLSVSLNDPSFPLPINARLIKTGVETYSLMWERPRPSYAKAAA